MCSSTQVSFVAAAVLAPTSVFAMHRAYRAGRRYLALATLPLLFAAQQFFEGLVWISGSQGNAELVAGYSLAYMFSA